MDSSSLNETSSFSHTEFILFEFPEVTKFRPLLTLPFLVIYTVILLASSIVMIIIVLEKSLHCPMYLLIWFLLALDVLHTSAITPKMILALVGLDHISLPECLTQMFIVNSSMMAESIVVLLLIVDQYVAITQPLHYQKIIAKHLLVHSTIHGVIRNCCAVFPIVILASKLLFCKSNIIHHFHCENMVIFKLGCGDVSWIQVAGLLVRTLITVLDITFVLFSYLRILSIAMKVALGMARHKALHTCATHLGVTVTIYSSGLFSSILSLPGVSSSYTGQNISSAVYFLFPATVSPFIYGLRMKKIKKSLMKHWRTTKEDTSLTCTSH
ncbi:olfactory receptor 52K2-like [Engystomops pustulosus]|uniref:olfactory receptor 52K2-like n=1 Tax=Engystomops pustulosus TaxID=76066 RepID=UPI003AFADAB9